jgi:hypothetical protein
MQINKKPRIDTKLQHPRIKVRTFNIQKYKQEHSTFKRNNKKIQHLKAKAKTFNLFQNKNKNLQSLK